MVKKATLEKIGTYDTFEEAMEALVESQQATKEAYD